MPIIYAKHILLCMLATTMIRIVDQEDITMVGARTYKGEYLMLK
jgi:hypothetical protein